MSPSFDLPESFPRDRADILTELESKRALTASLAALITRFEEKEPTELEMKDALIAAGGVLEVVSDDLKRFIDIIGNWL